MSQRPALSSNSHRKINQAVRRPPPLARSVALWGILMPLGGAALFVCGVIGAGMVTGRVPNVRAALMQPVNRLAEAAGFGLQQVSISGLRFTADTDVFDALDLPRARSLLGFDGRAAQARIEALPWVERVSIDRVFPDGLAVRIIERQPFAVWRQGSRHWVIDRRGLRLAPVSADAMPGLRRVAGEGAEIAAAGLFARMAQHPALLERVQLAERHGDRRWSLHLTRGAIVHLPQDEEAEALARANILVSAGLAEKGEIDLRVVGRDLLRGGKGSGGVPARAAAETKTVPGRS